MITKVVHGWRVGGLIAYLMGPGRAEEHREPRVVASWDGLDAAWQPARTGPSEWDLDLDPLVGAMRAPVIAAGLAEGDSEGRRGFVWHCSARVAGRDRVLSDEEWAGVARELLDGAGIAATGDAGGPRWVAVRHADDHIHIAVVLVRQDTCRRFWPYREFPRLREAARAVERRLGLTVTARADGTAARAPLRGELEKAARQGREPARVELARAVRAAVLVSDGPESLVERLTEAGYLVELRRAPSGDPLGYKVARVGDVSAAGVPVFYSGSKLAPDLSLPRLLRVWGEAATPVVYVDADRVVGRAAGVVASVRAGGRGDDPDGIAHAAAEVLTAMRGPAGWGPRWGSAADAFDRAARAPGVVIGVASGTGAGLRRTARLLVRHRYRLGGGECRDDAAAVALAVALAALIQEIAGWHRDRGRGHQAVAAESAATVVRGLGSATPVSIRGCADDTERLRPGRDHTRVDAGPRIDPSPPEHSRTSPA